MAVDRLLGKLPYPLSTENGNVRGLLWQQMRVGAEINSQILMGRESKSEVCIGSLPTWIREPHEEGKTVGVREHGGHRGT